MACSFNASRYGWKDLGVVIELWLSRIGKRCSADVLAHDETHRRSNFSLPQQGQCRLAIRLFMAINFNLNCRKGLSPGGQPASVCVQQDLLSHYKQICAM
jgi:hypothetical protein